MRRVEQERKPGNRDGHYDKRFGRDIQSSTIWYQNQQEDAYPGERQTDSVQREFIIFTRGENISSGSFKLEHPYKTQKNPAGEKPPKKFLAQKPLNDEKITKRQSQE